MGVLKEFLNIHCQEEVLKRISLNNGHVHIVVDNKPYHLSQKLIDYH